MEPDHEPTCGSWKITEERYAMKVNPLFIPCPACGVAANSYCRDLVTNAPTMTFHGARVQAANE